MRPREQSDRSDSGSGGQGGGPWRHWRGTPFAMVLVATLLAMGGAGCAGDGEGKDGRREGAKGGREERSGELDSGKVVLPVPADFRERLVALVANGRYDEAAALLKATSPDLLARAASERGDIQYLSVMGVGPVTPGLPPTPRPSRTWVLPGTSDYQIGEDVARYNVRAHDFAKAFNVALAQEERGVR